ncbi:SusC/RagA family TonB-linked outer membrane protein [Pedobacter sp. Leaf41]|uniref:SusC/RagA family TonB-linked outer membrane protein n=1 Tax=Pedobacter sp. Leaf41 TaxID=1736218 RepID=UPI000A5DB227|nr:SusC/RagA family TonB-linked outer membrane protein [Pedobacter sp. Leaf41]
MTNHYFRFVRSGCGYLLNWSAFLCIAMLVSLNVSAQTNQYNFVKAPLNTVISEISTKTSYEFVYDAELVKKAKPISLSLSTTSIRILMDAVVKGQDFAYEINNNKTIVLKAVAQNPEEYIVHGMVTDSIGGPLPGASVKIKGANKYTTTDGNGHFNIGLSNNYNNIDVNYIGYLSETKKIERSAAQNVVTIKLKSNASLLADVVVNGYQSLPKERQTGSFAVVDSATLNRQINPDLLAALEGKVAGLMYTKNPNGLNADQPVLRGVGTYSANVGTSPLIVVDGLPSELTLDQINPYDVESITVLKDGAAASIYGSRSGNGVIVIATKGGKAKGVNITLNADLFITGKPDIDKMHYASTSDLIDYETAVYNTERARFTTTESMFSGYGNVNNGTIKYYSPLYELYRQQATGAINTTQLNSTINQLKQNDYIKDYVDNVWQNEVRQRYNLSFNSGNGKSSNYLSLNYDASDERMKYNNSENFNIYNKSTFNLKKWLTATIGINASYNTSSSSNFDYTNYLIQPRYAQITDANGNLVYSDYVNLSDGFSSSGAVNAAVISTLKNNNNFKSFGFNLLESMQEGLTKNKAINLRTFANVKANIYKGLSYSMQFQYENRNADSESFHDKNSYRMRYAYNYLTSYNATTGIYTRNLPDGGRYYQINRKSNSYTFRNQLSYDNSFGKNQEHNIAAIAGVEMRQTLTPRTLETVRYGYDPVTLSSTTLNTAALSTAGVASYIGGTRTLSALATKQEQVKHRYLSAYSNMSYTFQGKYNLTGSIRVDQADLFGVDPQYKNRPLWSVGLGWNANREDFLKNVEWLNMLKLRATYGINGNVDQNSSPYLTATLRNDVLFPSLQYTNISALPNPKLRWEKVASTNFGIDFSTLSNRLRGSIDLYNKYSSDLLVSTELDPTVGAISRVLNNGALRNRGIELNLTGDWYKANDLAFSSQFVIGFNKNKVMEVNTAAQNAYSYIGAPTNYFFINQQYNSLYAYRYGGMTNGYPYFLDENGNSNVTFNAAGVPTAVKDITNTSAIVNMGSLTPLYSGSFSQRVSYKSFELSAMLVFSGGNKLRKDVTDLSSNTVYDQDITQRWTANTISELPRLYVDYANSALNYASTLSSLWKYSDVQILDASYIKLRNIILSYNLPQQVSRLIHVSNVRLSGQVNNLWYWSAAGDDIDPETYSANSGTRSLQIPKTFIFGLNVTF